MKKRRTWFIEFTVQYLMKQGWQPTKVEWGWGEDPRLYDGTVLTQELRLAIELATYRTVQVATLADVVRACRRAGTPKFAHEAISIWFVHEQHGLGDVLFVQQEFWVTADWGAQTCPPPTEDDMAGGNFHSHENNFSLTMEQCSAAEDEAWAAKGGCWGVEAIPL